LQHWQRYIDDSAINKTMLEPMICRQNPRPKISAAQVVHGAPNHFSSQGCLTMLVMLHL